MRLGMSLNRPPSPIYAAWQVGELYARFDGLVDASTRPSIAEPTDAPTTLTVTTFMSVLLFCPRSSTPPRRVLLTHPTSRLYLTPQVHDLFQQLVQQGRVVDASDVHDGQPPLSMATGKVRVNMEAHDHGFREWFEDVWLPSVRQNNATRASGGGATTPLVPAVRLPPPSNSVANMHAAVSAHPSVPIGKPHGGVGDGMGSPMAAGYMQLKEEDEEEDPLGDDGLHA